jgi:plastocyanin
MRRILTAAVLAMVLTAAACASDGSSSGSGGGLYGGGSSSSGAGASGSSASASAGGGGRYGYGGGGGSGSGSGGGGGPVAGSVVVANFSFTPSTVQVKSGATIALNNTNPQTPHTFTVSGQDIDASLDPLSTTKVTIDLPPGTYPFICRFHSGSGMKGTLVVE